MLCVQVTAPGRLTVGEGPEPDAAEQALIRVHRVGICGTDLKILKGAVSVDYPRIMGHEMVGEVARPGPEGITTSGQRVLVDPAVSCGRCGSCWAGRTHLCTNGGLLGRDVDGGFATFVAVPESCLVPVPRSLSDASSALLQVLGTCVHALRSVSVFPGDVAAVVGLGVSGLLFVQLLRAQGAAVVGVTRSPWKREVATGLGAVASASPEEAEVVVREMSNGRGAEVVVEAAGSEATFGQAIELARPGGEVVAFGTITDAGGASGGQTDPPYYQLYLKELVVHHPRAALPADYRRGVELAESGVLRLDPLVTHRFGLAEAEAAFTAMQDPSSLKVVMQVA
jgi:2-desacetyl-2-hydroxyethyl bacteriochlorophyllide A dehydrogenase